jgi:formylmethanofuran dehydrogenase subunit E
MFNFLDDLKALYSKAGYIKIFDPHALEIGIRPGENVVCLSLLDIGKLTGHVCPGVTSAYFIAKAAVKALYNNEIPTRENFQVAVSANNDISLVQSMVFDAFPAPEGSGLIGKMFLDPSLNLGDGMLKFIFRRIDTGKTIAVLWNKRIAVPPEVAEKMKYYKELKIREKYEYLDHLEWNTYVNRQVEKIIIDLNQKMIDVEDASDYLFPGEMKLSLI